MEGATARAIQPQVVEGVTGCAIRPHVFKEDVTAHAIQNYSKTLISPFLPPVSNASEEIV